MEIHLDEAKSFSERRFILGNPATEDAVMAFESKYGVTLPSEYRQFLLQVSNGAENIYGIPRDVFRLGEMDMFKGSLERLSQPFPHSQPRFNVEANYYNEIQGAMPFLNEGCGINYFLVVTGAERGNIWVVDFTNSDFVVPLPKYHWAVPEYTNSTTERIGFWEWFRWWDAMSTVMAQR